MILLFLILGISGKSIYVDTIELNHVYDRNGKFMYSQVILWDVDASDHKEHNLGWQMVSDLRCPPMKCKDKCIVKYKDLSIISYNFRESHTNFDKEREDSRVFWNNNPPNLFSKEKAPAITDE